MNRSTDVMQYILDLLTDSIIVSVNQQLAFTDVSTINVEDMPFVQAFNPVIVSPTAVQIQSKGDLTFVVQVIDALGTVVVGQTTDLREVGDQLAATLSIDTGLRGIGAHCFISESLVDDSQFNDRTILQMTIVCELLESNGPEFVNFADFSDGDKFGEVTGLGTLKVSTRVANAVAFKRAAVNESMFRWDNVTDPAGFPNVDNSLNMSMATDHIRCQFYQQLDASKETLFFELRIGDFAGVGNPLNNYRRYVETRSFHGWNEFVFQLDSPFSTVGSPRPLTEVEAVQFVSNKTGGLATDADGMAYTRLGYFRRDRSENVGRGIHPGF